MRDSSLVKMGTTADQKKLFFRLRRAKAELGFYDDGDLPDEIVKTIASNLEVDPKSVVQMNRRLSGDASLNAPSAETGMEMIDALADADAGPDVILERKDAKVRHSALVEYGLEALNERERDIFVRRNLIDDKLTLEELGAVYGVTRERIRQIEQKALKKFGDRVA
jgi:RNA polymerase sigma-32 factor